MTVGELMDILATMDKDLEVVLYKRGSYYSPSYSTTRIKVSEGFLVRDEEDSGSFLTKRDGNGLFVDNDMAHRVMDDGQTFLNFDSPTIHRAISIDLPKY